MRIAIYARVITDAKGQDPLNQLLQLREFAARQGWTVVRDTQTRPVARTATASSFRRCFATPDVGGPTAVFEWGGLCLLHAALSIPSVTRTDSTLMWRDSRSPHTSAKRLNDSMARFSSFAGISCTLTVSSRLYFAVERVTAKVLGQKDLWYANVSWTDYK